ncbi:unnamed protein product [Didymodactylos carnosus]|uniref:Uncharacterized protein n=1 Tax=Didymodactylos carnosus TaxID=1234261 RepID=A0A815C7N5_9BILA|nr:unnamed protein product [Didymodactylos carnosus]CAF4074554.1 unnamed protein product [Didymodactylos carnosus]
MRLLHLSSQRSDIMRTMNNSIFIMIDKLRRSVITIKYNRKASTENVMPLAPSTAVPRRMPQRLIPPQLNISHQRQQQINPSNQQQQQRRRTNLNQQQQQADPGQQQVAQNSPNETTTGIGYNRSVRTTLTTTVRDCLTQFQRLVNRTHRMYDRIDDIIDNM